MTHISCACSGNVPGSFAFTLIGGNSIFVIIDRDKGKVTVWSGLHFDKPDAEPAGHFQIAKLRHVDLKRALSGEDFVDDIAPAAAQMAGLWYAPTPWYVRWSVIFLTLLQKKLGIGAFAKATTAA